MDKKSEFETTEAENNFSLPDWYKCYILANGYLREDKADGKTVGF